MKTVRNLSILALLVMGLSFRAHGQQESPPETTPETNPESSPESTPQVEVDPDAPYLVVLGIAQDAGYPQAGCKKDCCEKVRQGEATKKHVSCLALVDPVSGDRWMFDATPDFREQLRMLDEIAPPTGSKPPSLKGIFLTHAHIGHYTGIMFLGHESIGADKTNVYVMPRMRMFLSNNGPWEQLVNYENIKLRPIMDRRPIRLNDRLTVTPVRIPHREEYSEVVGYRIDGPNATALFIPDIDKWEAWDQRLENVLLTVDVAYLDGTFYANGEIPGRDMASIPHPFIKETVARLKLQLESQRSKVRFIHLNHTNPALQAGSEARKAIETAGMRVAREGERFGL
ncbi:MAG: MBL fold metallo-hydrolase [Planctomycetota bacterium]|nr:MBL fold metallo-hydrolase [Planctomycetota bacterium]